MNVNDKIKQILIDKSLSPSVFADEIGVQRSSISHILSGRNRPSFDIIQKVIRRFPDLGYDWIMEDDNQQEQSFGSARVATRQVPSARTSSIYATKEYKAATGQQPALNTARISPLQQTAIPELPTLVPVAQTADKAVERILIFYTDGTFREYTPAV